MKNIVILLILFLFFCGGLNFISAQNLFTGNAISGSTNVTFTTGSNGWRCANGTDLAYWENISNGYKVMIYNSTYSSKDICFNGGYSDTECCPTGFTADNSGGHYECVISSNFGCAAKLNSDTCNNATSDIAIPEVEKLKYEGACSSSQAHDPLSSCYTASVCKCTWNETQKKCGSSYTTEKCCGPIINNVCTDLTSVSCTWMQDSIRDLCNESAGKISINYKAYSSLPTGEDLECINKEIDYPCSVSVKLPFFSWFNFVVAASGIAIAYFLMRRK